MGNGTIDINGATSINGDGTGGDATINLEGAKVFIGGNISTSDTLTFIPGTSTVTLMILEVNPSRMYQERLTTLL